jgi:hypothetical protein
MTDSDENGEDEADTTTLVPFGTAEYDALALRGRLVFTFASLSSL